MLIDYSSWKEFSFCPASWYEKYINHLRPKWPTRLRDDALCLGSLVHEGLEVWQKEHRIGIPEGSIDKNTPTPDCLQSALGLVYGYSQAYPEERWPLILCEEPIKFPLMEGLEGLAKIDAFFYVPEPYIIESGQPGLQFTLSPGWWIHEYKTKSREIELGLFMQKWNLNMQPSFQILALQNHLQWAWLEKKLPLVEFQAVQGVLINILEKPKKYIPKRKCRVCQELYEYALWLPTGEGEYSCPVCGNRQKLEPIKENPMGSRPEYYRIIVTRTNEQLAKARRDMVRVGERMLGMAKSGDLYSEPWNTENCIAYRKPCGYLHNHTHGVSTLVDINMEQTENYRGVIEDGI